MGVKMRFVKMLLSLLTLLAILHLAFHVAVFGSGISNFYESGISGFSIGKLDLGDEFKQSYPKASNISIFSLITEWSVLILSLVFVTIRNKLHVKREIIHLSAKKMRKKATKTTDLDKLYDILKDKKRIRLSTVQKIFGVDKNIALEWAKTLESGDLASIDYPRMREPELVYDAEE